MFTWIDNLEGLELLFACCAIFGTTLFVIRLVLMFIGIGDTHPGDSGHLDTGHVDTGDVGHADHQGDFHDSDLSFKVLSLQGITAFFMMFGLVGWAFERQGSFPAILSIIFGAVAGLLTIWIMKKLFQMAGKLQSSGTLNMQNAIGQEGQVYLTIHPGQIGKVQVVVQDRMLVLNAMAESSAEEIKTGQRVWVTRISADTLIVGKLES